MSFKTPRVICSLTFDNDPEWITLFSNSDSRLLPLVALVTNLYPVLRHLTGRVELDSERADSRAVHVIP